MPTPLDLWPEFRDATKQVVSVKPASASNFKSLEEAEKALEPTYYASALLLAFAVRWQKVVELHTRKGWNAPIQKNMKTLMKLPEYIDLTKEINKLKERISKNHPLFLLKHIDDKKTKWIKVKSEANEILKKNSLGGVIGKFYPEEMKIINNLDFLIPVSADQVKLAKEQINSGSTNYNSLFEKPTDQLLTLIKNSLTKTEKDFRKDLYRDSLEEDEHDIFKESHALWETMWKVARGPPLSKEDNIFFRWLQKRGSTHENPVSPELSNNI